MTTLWRISNYTDLSGKGARGASGRWHTMGRLVVYLADNPASAMLERIVHLTDRNEDGILPRSFQLLQVSVPDEILIKPLSTLTRIDWKDYPELTRQIGETWLASRETALARVPSAIMPRTWNVLLNPEHPDANKIEITETITERFDNRLFRFGPR